jgi:hypothetical protein
MTAAPGTVAKPSKHPRACAREGFTPPGGWAGNGRGRGPGHGGPASGMGWGGPPRGAGTGGPARAFQAADGGRVDVRATPAEREAKRARAALIEDLLFAIAMGGTTDALRIAACVRLHAIYCGPPRPGVPAGEVRQHAATEAEQKACEIRLRAERRAGQMLGEMEKAKGGGDPRPEHRSHAARGGAKPLSDLGISHTQSSRWQAGHKSGSAGT